MKFKIDKNLYALIAVYPAPTTAEKFSADLCQYMIEAGIIEDTPDNWGESVLIATGNQYVKDVCDLLAGFLKVSRIHTDTFDAFCRLTVVGNGNCPNCGGELLFDETKGHELKDGDYYTPNSYVVDYYLYHCPICGETIKSENEL